MNKSGSKIILALETSCDETAAAVLETADGGKWPEIKTLSSVVKSQMEIHSKMGGVVPEAAARAHVKNILPVTRKALVNANLSLADVDFIAVTHGPGLIPSLIVGVEFAKALAYGAEKPIIPVNHMLGHLYSPFISTIIHSRMIVKIFPMISLVVSGGHTILVLMKNEKEYKVLGETVDDAAGEAFDKVAKLLKLPYPGGPEISQLAVDGNPTAINFPRPMINHKNYSFSFAGLKTAVLYYLRNNNYLSFPTRAYLGKAQVSRNRRRESMSWIPDQVRNDICASFQQAVVDVLVAKTLRAAEEYQAGSISLSGGVAANKSLRNQLNLKSKILNLKFFMPPLNLCTDNAEMIGIAAAFMLHNGFKPKSFKNIKANPNLQL